MTNQLVLDSALADLELRAGLLAETKSRMEAVQARLDNYIPERQRKMVWFLPGYR
jgi:hypothetical protein